MQYYVDPFTVKLSDDAPPWPSWSLKTILDRDGQIVPILVTSNKDDETGEHYFRAATGKESERVMALREMAWPTILVEDNWTEDDL